MELVATELGGAEVGPRFHVNKLWRGLFTEQISKHWLPLDRDPLPTNPREREATAILIGAWHCPCWLSPQAQLLWAQKYHILISALWQRQSGSSSDTSLLPSAWVQTAKYLVPVVTVDSISRNAMQLESIFSHSGKSLHGYISSQQTQESIMIHREINSNAI